MQQPSKTGYDGKYDKFSPLDGGGAVVEWQPGDGTRYVLTVRPVTNAMEARVLGCSLGDILATFSVRDGMVSLCLTDGALHHYSYIGEKLQRFGITGEGTLLPLVALLNLAMGDVSYGEEMYCQMMAIRGN